MQPPFLLEADKPIPHPGLKRVNLLVNGEKRELGTRVKLHELLDLLGVKPRGVAIEVNRLVVLPDRWQATELSEGDQVEIVQLVGGGT